MMTSATARLPELTTPVFVAQFIFLNISVVGYTPSEISRIQVEAERDNTQTSALSILLSDWSKKPYSTVGNIIQALAGINRHDLIQLIHSRNSMSGSEVV